MTLARFPFRPRDLFVASFLFHVAVILAVGNYFYPALWENGNMALSVYEGRGLACGMSSPTELTAWQAPGYPYLLSTAWKLFGLHSILGNLVISVLQALVIASTVYPMIWLTRRWLGEETAVIAGVLTVFLPLFAWYVTRLHQTALVMAMHPWMVWGWVSLPRQRPVPRILTAGVITGLGGLFQPVMLVAGGLISGFLLLRSMWEKQSASALKIILGGLLTLLIITPWTIRNYDVFHRFILIKDSFGKELWMGNNPYATGTDFAEGGQDLYWAHPPKAQELVGHAPEIVVFDALQKESLDWMKSHPRQVAALAAKKFLWFWTMTPSRFVRSTNGGEALKFGFVEATAWFSCVALAILGLRRQRWPVEYLTIFLIYVVLYSAIYSLTHVGQVRFRGEMEFIILPATASGLLWLIRRVRPSASPS